MFVVGVDELKKPLGEKIQCPKCGQQHEVEYGEKILPDGSKQPSKTLAFYVCGKHSYIAGINGFAIPKNMKKEEDILMEKIYHKCPICRRKSIYIPKPGNDIIWCPVCNGTGCITPGSATE